LALHITNTSYALFQRGIQKRLRPFLVMSTTGSSTSYLPLAHQRYVYHWHVNVIPTTGTSTLRLSLARQQLFSTGKLLSHQDVFACSWLFHAASEFIILISTVPCVDYLHAGRQEWPQGTK